MKNFVKAKAKMETEVISLRETIGRQQEDLKKANDKIQKLELEAGSFRTMKSEEKQSRVRFDN